MDSAVKYINLIARCTALYRNGKLENEGLNGYQHGYILGICQNPGLSQEQLAKAVCTHKSSVTRQLALLEQNGFITRIPGETDKRIMRVFPTRKAFDILPKIRELLAEWNSYLLSGLTEEELHSLLSMLKQIAEKARKKADKEMENEENA